MIPTFSLVFVPYWDPFGNFHPWFGVGPPTRGYTGNLGLIYIFTWHALCQLCLIGAVSAFLLSHFSAPFWGGCLPRLSRALCVCWASIWGIMGFVGDWDAHCACAADCRSAPGVMRPYVGWVGGYKRPLHHSSSAVLQGRWRYSFVLGTFYFHSNYSLSVSSGTICFPLDFNPINYLLLSTPF